MVLQNKRNGAILAIMLSAVMIMMMTMLDVVHSMAIPMPPKIMAGYLPRSAAGKRYPLCTMVVVVGSLVGASLPLSAPPLRNTDSPALVIWQGSEALVVSILEELLVGIVGIESQIGAFAATCRKPVFTANAGIS